MRRNVVFEKGRPWRVEDNQMQDLHLGPGRGAAIGEYMTPEASKYSDSFYGPGRAGHGRRGSTSYVGGVVGNPPRARTMNHISANRLSSGELHPGQRSWADVGADSVHPGQSGVTGTPSPSFRGQGPKGYRRSDERIKEIVCEVLTDDPQIDASEIDIEVRNGEITLSGTIDDRRAKWHIEELIEERLGTVEINNRLRCA